MGVLVHCGPAWPADPDRDDAITAYCQSVAQIVRVVANGRDHGMTQAQQTALQQGQTGIDPALLAAATDRVYRDPRPGSEIAQTIFEQCQVTVRQHYAPR